MKYCRAVSKVSQGGLGLGLGRPRVRIGLGRPRFTIGLGRPRVWESAQARFGLGRSERRKNGERSE